MYKRDEVKKEPGPLAKLAMQCEEDTEKWYGNAPCTKSIPHHSLALISEAGGFANIVKEIERGALSIGDAKVRYALTMELTDVFVELLNIAALLHIDLEESYKYVRAANEKRFAEERTRRDSNGRP